MKSVSKITGMGSASPLSVGFTLADYRRAYATGHTPRSLLVPLREALHADDPAWISIASPAQLEAQLSALEARGDAHELARTLPLYGVPFGVKDNIDVATFDTTAACPAFAQRAHSDAAVVARLREAGAIVFGKTNLDQFATGLVGVRSPYGVVPNTFDARYISGGSSSGSGSVVARGLVPFALGTDTAGSGRVPAAFNSIVGMKPSCGRLSTRGVVPACRTLDCVSVFSLTVGDAELVTSVAAGYDPDDPYSKDRALASAPRTSHGFTLAVPRALEFFGDERAEAAFAATLRELVLLGAQVTEIDFADFRALAQLLYQGPWVAERYAVMEQTLAQQPDAVDRTVRKVVESAPDFSALDAFRAEYKRAELARRIQICVGKVDALLLPTTPSIYTREELEREPILLNSRLGTYTNFVNLADLSALALPGVPRSDGLPAGITLIANAGEDASLLRLARVIEAHLKPARGVTKNVRQKTEAVIEIAVVGAHLRGMPLHHQLEAAEAVFVGQATTKSIYKLFALPNTKPEKPGLVKHTEGASIELEIYALSPAAFGKFVAEVPAPMVIGTIELADGRAVKGFLCEPWAITGARDITAFGGFRAYVASLA